MNRLISRSGVDAQGTPVLLLMRSLTLALAGTTKPASATPAQIALAEVLLAIAGETVSIPIGPTCEQLVADALARGVLTDNARVQRGPGQPGACHLNVATLVRTSPAIRHEVGFALGGSLWTHHAWGRLSDADVIVETTPLPWTHYFGSEVTT
jgi:hypothetical protein